MLAYISSYAQAEKLGMKPFDSMISKVVLVGKKPKLVAFLASSTRSGKDAGKYTMGKTLHTYVDRSGTRYYATGPASLKILLDALYTRRPRVSLVQARAVRLGR